LLKLDYILVELRMGEAERSLADANADDFGFELFLGDIRFSSETANFDTDWKWIPLFDFATAFADIAGKLEHDDKATFTFTESEAVITFARRADRLNITASYAPGTIECSRRELKKATEDLLARLSKELASRYPELKTNDYFKHKLREYGITG
jgi:hypothetical protein